MSQVDGALFLSMLTNAFSSSRFQPASGLEHLALTAAAKVGKRGYGSSLGSATVDDYPERSVDCLTEPMCQTRAGESGS